MSSVKRGRYVNKVALIALKYFNALITAKLIASINALTLTALLMMFKGTFRRSVKLFSHQLINNHR